MQPPARYPAGPFFWRRALREARSLTEAQEVGMAAIRDWEAVHLYALLRKGLSLPRFEILMEEAEAMGISQSFLDPHPCGECEGQMLLEFGSCGNGIEDWLAGCGEACPQGKLEEFPA